MLLRWLGKWKRYYKIGKEADVVTLETIFAKSLLLSVVMLILCVIATFTMSITRYKLFPCHQKVITARIERTPRNKKHRIKLYLDPEEVPVRQRNAALLPRHCAAPLKLSDLDAFRAYIAGRAHSPSYMRYDEFFASISRVFKDFRYHAVCNRYGCYVYTCAKFRDVLLFATHEECIKVPFEAVTATSAELFCVGVNCSIQKGFPVSVSKRMKRWSGMPFKLRIYNFVTYLNAYAAAAAVFFFFMAILLAISLAHLAGVHLLQRLIGYRNAR